MTGSSMHSIRASVCPPATPPIVTPTERPTKCAHHSVEDPDIQGESAARVSMKISQQKESKPIENGEAHLSPDATALKESRPSMSEPFRRQECVLWVASRSETLLRSIRM
mmetsp:Transcript_35943/g.95397  ORF Transcript_35943/g.95397 Transcript_35943/m.95397 type:complete len:110 (-) Transcript_35943:43-372(-)